MRPAFSLRNKGFTLVELLVTLAVMCIVLAAVGGILVTGAKLVGHTGNRFDEHAAALSLMKRVTSTVRNSTALTIYAGPAGTDPAGLDGYLYYDDTVGELKTRASAGAAETVYRPGLAAGYTASVSFQASGSTALAVTVTVAMRAQPQNSYTLTGEVALVNMSLWSSAIQDTTGGSGTLVAFTRYTQPGS